MGSGKQRAALLERSLGLLDRIPRLLLLLLGLLPRAFSCQETWPTDVYLTRAKECPRVLKVLEEKLASLPTSVKPNATITPYYIETPRMKRE